MRYSLDRGCNSSLLVGIYLWEQDIEAAWKQAKSGGASPQLWHQLAEKREKTHPADAAAAYQHIVEAAAARGGNESYRDAVKLVAKIQTLLNEAKRE